MAACSGAAWSQAYATSYDDVATDVAVDAACNIYITGTFDGSIDFGQGPLPDKFGGDHVFLAKLDAAGHTLWSHSMGGYGDSFGPHLTVTPSGEVVLVSTSGGSSISAARVP